MLEQQLLLSQYVPLSVTISSSNALNFFLHLQLITLISVAAF